MIGRRVTGAHGALALVLLALAGCGSVPTNKPIEPPPARPRQVLRPPEPVLPAAGSGRGGYYKDDGPGDNPPPDLDLLPDAPMRNEPYSTRANRPYVVFGKTYMPFTHNEPFTQRGIGSWYGKKFHGQRTSSGEIYDMYKMTAAHPTLPIPSYARLTSIESGKQVVVRINDRGPFHLSRAIDVSYAAALKLGLLSKGSHELLIERVLPAEIDRMTASNGAGYVAPATAAALWTASVSPAAGLPNWKMPERESGAGKAAGASGFYLQLGAFSQAANAEAARTRLVQYAEAMAGLEVVQSGRVFRLYGGPFTSREEALLAAQGLPSGLSLKPIVVQR